MKQYKNTPSALTAIIFDMDGLMVDTEPLSQDIWSQIVSRYGVTLDESVYARMVGLRSSESVHIIRQAYHLPLTAQELVTMRNAMWEARWREGVPIRPGLYQLHDEISRRGVPWAVATSSPRHYAEGVLKQLALQPTNGAIAAGDEVAHSKPAPDIYLLAAERLGTHPATCLALEDSVPGGRAAQAAGMTLVAVPAGTTSRADFDFAPFVFDSLADVAGNLDTLFALTGAGQ
jgi:HAD superfamily hydrolase (TIGR01509 family)